MWEEDVLAEDPLAARCAAELLARALPEGGFASRPGGAHRPDASAWATLALCVGEAGGEAVRAARDRLAREQRDDGSVSAHPEHPAAAWPTPVAVLAWHGSPYHALARERAVAYLLATAGAHWPVEPGAAPGHDTSLRGWPWVQETHSWVEPTALGLLALEAAGHPRHPRVAEARRLLLDRALPGGGWNYGNTRVFGRVLRPLPESTGVALAALGGGPTERASVRPGLAYLETELARIRTPFTLGWGLLGLGIWQVWPEPSARWVEETLARVAQLGPFDTAHLALLLLGYRARSGALPVPFRAGSRG